MPTLKHLALFSPRTDAAATEGEPAAAIDADEIVRTARELVDAYGPRAIALMRKRTRAVRQRGDAESATLWSAVAAAVEAQLAGAARLRAEAGSD
jgi:hypothetical protein